MKIVQRQVGIAILLALLTISITSIAQDEDAFTITGSRPVIDVLNTIIDSSELETNIESSSTGSTNGFIAFCQNESDITVATRPLSVDEEASCVQNEISYEEYLIGYDVLAIVANPDYVYDTCLTNIHLNTIFAPSAQGINTDWSDVFSTTPTETDSGQETVVDASPITIYLPANNTSTYAQLDDIVDGVGLRSDVAQSNNIVSLVEETPGAIGVVSLSEIADASVTILELQNPELRQCFAPSIETVESRQYLQADRLFVYVNQNAVEALDELLTVIVSEETSESIANNGFTPVSSNIYAQNKAILTGEVETGRLFSADVTAFEIPVNVFGTINIGGTASLNDFVTNAANAFTAEYPGVTITATLESETVGERQLCNGEISILAATKELDAETIQNCEANNVSTTNISIGNKATILVANEETPYLDCLTVDQVIATWSASTAETNKIWSDVDASFPETEMMLFAPPFGQNEYGDILLATDDSSTIPIRADVTENNQDILYRAAATANVEGSLTYMSWQQYQSALGSGQANIKLVAIDAGNGCVTPSEETIANGDYPYTRSFSFIVNQAALSESAVQSFIWYLFSDQNYVLYSIADIIAPAFSDLPSIRENLQESYTEAIAAALEVVEPEATPEVEATEEASN